MVPFQFWNVEVEDGKNMSQNSTKQDPATLMLLESLAEMLRQTPDEKLQQRLGTPLCDEFVVAWLGQAGLRQSELQGIQAYRPNVTVQLAIAKLRDEVGSEQLSA